MSPPDQRSESDAITRRRILILGGAATTAVLSGCLGDESDDPDASSDETDGSDDQTETNETDELADDSNEEEASDSVVRVPVGTTAENVDVTEPHEVTEALAAEFDLADYEVRLTPAEDTVELYADVSGSVFIEALGAAGVETADVEVHSGVTADTLNIILDVLEHRFDNTDVDASVRAHEERSAVVFEGRDADSESIDELLEPMRVEVVAGYPDPDADEPVLETVLTQEDIVNVAPAEQGDENGSPTPHVPVQLSDEAAERFATTASENDFTTDGVGKCSFEPADEPDSEGYCFYTVFDGEFIHGAAMSPGLADVIEAGEFEENPSFVFQTSEFETAQKLELALRAGQLPTELESP